MTADLEIEVAKAFARYHTDESRHTMPVPKSDRACLACIHILAVQKIKEALCDHQRPDIEWFKIMQCVEQIVPEWKGIDL